MIKKASRKYYRDKELLIKIGKNLRKCRTEIGIPLKTLSDQSNIGFSHLNRIEQGKVNFRISYLYKLAGVMTIDPGKLLS